MKIAVCLKQTPATTANIRVRDSADGLELSGVEMVVNPYDEYALEQALRVRDAVGGSEIIAVSVGGDDAAKILQQAFALGVDQAVLIKAEDLEPQAAAACIAAFLKGAAPDLVFCGRQAVDDEQWFFPAALGERLDMPHVTAACEFELTAGNAKVTCKRRAEGGDEVVEMQLPAVVSCDKGLNEPRVPTLKGRLAAKKKKAEIKTPADIGVADADLAAQLNIVKYEPPPAKSPGKILSDPPPQAAAELVRLLREEARVV